MAFWLKNGSLVVDAEGHPINCASCPCSQTPCATELATLRAEAAAAGATVIEGGYLINLSGWPNFGIVAFIAAYTSGGTVHVLKCSCSRDTYPASSSIVQQASGLCDCIDFRDIVLLHTSDLGIQEYLYGNYCEFSTDGGTTWNDASQEFMPQKIQLPGALQQYWHQATDPASIPVADPEILILHQQYTESGAVKHRLVQIECDNEITYGDEYAALSLRAGNLFQSSFVQNFKWLLWQMNDLAGSSYATEADAEYHRVNVFLNSYLGFYHTAPCWNCGYSCGTALTPAVRTVYSPAGYITQESDSRWWLWASADGMTTIVSYLWEVCFVATPDGFRLSDGSTVSTITVPGWSTMRTLLGLGSETEEYYWSYDHGEHDQSKLLYYNYDDDNFRGCTLEIPSSVERECGCQNSVGNVNLAE